MATSSVVKDRYNKKTYKDYKLRVRYDDNEVIEYLLEKTKEQSFNKYILELIKKDMSNG